MKLSILIILTFITLSQLFSQNQGFPFIRNYTPSEYHGYSQNWAAEQDNRGVMYFGNGKGILEYNGKNWRRFFTSKGTTILSMCKDNNGRIFIGAENEIGYLKADSTGLVNFVSLDYLIPEKENDFSYVWQSYCNNEGVFFVTSEKIIKIDEHFKVKFIKPFTTFFTSFMVNNQLFIQDSQKGLHKIINDSLVQYNGWEKLVDLRAILTTNNNLYIGISSSKGVIYFSETKLPEQQIAELNSYKNLKFYKGIKLYNNNYAIATMLGGIIIFDKNGKIIQEINLENGLIGNSVYSLFVDNEGELWAMLENGLSRIEVSVPITIYDKRLGITGITQDIIKIENNLLVATTDGLYKLNSSNFSNNKFINSNFKIYNNIAGQTFSVTNYNNHPVCCFIEGIYLTENLKNKLIYHDNYEICVENSRYFKNLIYYGGNNNFGFLKYEKNKWKHFDIKEKIKGDVYYIIEEQKNKFWASTVANGIYKIELLDSFTFNTEVTHFDTLNNLPNCMLEVRFVNGEMLIGSQHGIYQYNNKTNSFYLSKKYINDTLILSKPMYNIASDYDSSLWLMIDKTVTKLIRKNNTYEIFDIPFKRLVFNDLYSIYPDSNGITWIGTTDCVYRYDANIKLNKNFTFNTIISKVIYHKDTIFNGCYSDSLGYTCNIQPDWGKKKFPYSHNSFIFEFSAPSFNKEEDNLFSFYLEGFDDEWSDYTTINKKEYTNITEGTYIFHVKSRNIYGIDGNETTIEFTILPPWYRTLWAYFLYFLLLILVIYIVVVINTRRLKAANIKLEAIVLQRTEEIRHRNQEILQQKEEISTQRDEIEAQRDLVIIQKEHIEEIHKEVTDSINYAKRIQEAVLPVSAPARAVLGEHFILFKPKDIVSGDFYWATQTRGHVTLLIVAVADCTGHGVPGAFMSMLGISFLNEIVRKQEVTQANHVLNELRKEIINALQQKGVSGEQKDGMDISLLVVNTETNECQWAGANNPLYIVRGGQNPQGLTKPVPLQNLEGLEEIKGDKMPIAIYERMEPFTNHEFKVENGNCLYLFSDGFADQFGGAKGKKFMYKQFKEILVQTCPGTSQQIKTMNEQKEILDKIINEWIGNNEQIDDITVLGIKI